MTVVIGLLSGICAAPELAKHPPRMPGAVAFMTLGRSQQGLGALPVERFSALDLRAELCPANRERKRGGAVKTTEGRSARIERKRSEAGDAIYASSRKRAFVALWEV